MDPSLRFIWILVAMFFLFIALFFLTGVYIVRPGKYLLLTKKGKFYAKLNPGVYFFLPILFEAFAKEQEGDNFTLTYRKHTIKVQGTLQNPEDYCSKKKNDKSTIKSIIKKTGTSEEKSLQIKHELESSGWAIQQVTIEP